MAGLAASAEQAAALPPGEPVARDATVVPQREVAAWDAAVGPQQEAVAWDAAEEPQQEAASVEAAVPRQVAAGAVRQREAPDVQVVQRRAALPSAALWVFHRGQLRRPARPAPQPAA